MTYIWTVEDYDMIWAYGSSLESCLEQAKRGYRDDAIWHEPRSLGNGDFVITIDLPASDQPGQNPRPYSFDLLLTEHEVA